MPLRGTRLLSRQTRIIRRTLRNEHGHGTGVARTTGGTWGLRALLVPRRRLRRTSAYCVVRPSRGLRRAPFRVWTREIEGCAGWGCDWGFEKRCTRRFGGGSSFLRFVLREVLEVGEEEGNRLLQEMSGEYACAPCFCFIHEVGERIEDLSATHARFLLLGGTRTLVRHGCVSVQFLRKCFISPFALETERALAPAGDVDWRRETGVVQMGMSRVERI